MGRVVGPTGAYLVGFIVAAFVVGWLAERGWDRRVTTAVVVMLVGMAMIYLVGVSWLAASVGVNTAIPLGLLPFIPGDMVKILVAAAPLPTGWALVGREVKWGDT